MVQSFQTQSLTTNYTKACIYMYIQLIIMIFLALQPLKHFSFPIEPWAKSAGKRTVSEHLSMSGTIWLYMYMSINTCEWQIGKAHLSHWLKSSGCLEPPAQASRKTIWVIRPLWSLWYLESRARFVIFKSILQSWILQHVFDVGVNTI